MFLLKANKYTVTKSSMGHRSFHQIYENGSCCISFSLNTVYALDRMDAFCNSTEALKCFYIIIYILLEIVFIL